MSGDGPGLGFGAAAGLVALLVIGSGAARLGATFVTGTLFAAGHDLARATLRQAPRWRWAQHLPMWGRFAPAH